MRRLHLSAAYYHKARQSHRQDQTRSFWQTVFIIRMTASARWIYSSTMGGMQGWPIRPVGPTGSSLLRSCSIPIGSANGRGEHVPGHCSALTPVLLGESSLLNMQQQDSPAQAQRPQWQDSPAQAHLLHVDPLHLSFILVSHLTTWARREMQKYTSRHESRRVRRPFPMLMDILAHSAIQSVLF